MATWDVSLAWLGRTDINSLAIVALTLWTTVLTVLLLVATSERVGFVDELAERLHRLEEEEALRAAEARELPES